MLIFSPKRLYHKKKPAVAASPVPGALELVSGVYTINDALITLTFNRAIDISGIDPTQFIVKDGIGANSILQGTTAETSGDSAVIIHLEQIDTYFIPPATLDASSDNGIVAASDGATWAGVTGYVLELG